MSEPKKQKHKAKFRYHHDVIPIGYDFGATIRYENDSGHQFFQIEINFGRHMWTFTEYRLKGWYVEYDGEKVK